MLGINQQTNNKGIIAHFQAIISDVKSRISNLNGGVIGIDLGTANTLICTQNTGVVINEPSIVSYINEYGVQSAYLYGKEAKEMFGKVPLKITTSYPMEDGVITDDRASEDMIRHFMSKTFKTTLIKNPVVVVGVPISATNAEKKIIQESLERCNTKEVFLVYESIAAAIGADLPINQTIGSMIIDIGGGTTEISVISFGGIVKSKAFKYGGRKMDQMIVDFIKKKYHFLISINSAEDVKKKIGAAFLKKTDENKKILVQGRDLISCAPKEIAISQTDIVVALSEFTNLLIDNVKQILEMTPPELISDILKNGAVLCGGGANIQNLDYILQHTANLQTKIQNQPELCVINGLRKIIANYKLFDHVLFKQF